MQSTLGIYTSNRSLGPLRKVKVSKRIARGAVVIGLLEFLLGVGLLVGGVLLHVKDVNEDLEVSRQSYDRKYYGLWSSPWLIIAGVCGVVAWLMRERNVMIFFLVINYINFWLCINQAIFVLARAFWFKDFFTLSKCRDDNPDGHGLEYDPTGEDSDKRDCDEMNTIAKLFVLLAICCCFAIVISGAGFINSIFAITQTRRDQLKHLTRSVFRHAAHQNTAMWLENNVRFSTGSTIARSNIAMSVINEGDLSTPGPYIPSTPTTPTTPGYRDSSWA